MHMSEVFLAFDGILFFKLVGVLLLTGLVVTGLRKLHSRAQKIAFTLMALFFLASTFFFGEEGAFNEWAKHILFFAGQLFFYLFVYYLIRFHVAEQENKRDFDRPTAPPGAFVAGAVLPIQSGLGEWFSFLTEQGLQHILTVPILLLTVAVVRVQYLVLESKAFKSALNIFLWASASFVAIHVGEFMVESQNIIPSLTDTIEYIELLFFYIGILLLFLGIKKLRKDFYDNKARSTPYL